VSAIVARAVRVPRRTKRSCLAWPQAAAFRMLQNNLDPETPSVRTSSSSTAAPVAPRPSGQAFDRILETLRRLKDDETLLVQSGSRSACSARNEWAPRVLISNAMLVPKWAAWEEFPRARGVAGADARG
jgi:urocanate hydratase